MDDRLKESNGDVDDDNDIGTMFSYLFCRNLFCATSLFVERKSVVSTFLEMKMR